MSCSITLTPVVSKLVVGTLIELCASPRFSDCKARVEEAHQELLINKVISRKDSCRCNRVV